MESNAIEKKYRPYVVIASIAIPLVVALLFGVKIEGVDLSFLPPIYATLNAAAAVLLILAVIAIKNGNKKNHKRLVQLAILSSLLFLVGYVAYHITSDSTIYGDLDHNGERSITENQYVSTSMWVYFFFLFTHITLSIIVIPFVLNTYIKGWAGNYKAHKKWAKITFPLWLYVAISGVIVYLMISPYYA